MYDNMSDGEKLLALSLTLNQIQADTAKHEKILIVGNGELPLVEKVRNHDAFIKGFRYWARFLIGALIVQTLAFFFGILVALVRFLPVLEKLANQP